jgi:glutamyl-tRNA reductase
VGETQVMGQFKTFLSTLGAGHGPLRKTGQRLLSEARIISERHLRQLGSRSYGSATRKRVADCDRVVVIGTGALAEELMKFLAGEARPIDQWGRRPPAEIKIAAGVRYRMVAGSEDPASIDTVISTAPTALVIAAPVPSVVVDNIARRYPNLRKVVDLRAETDLGPLDVSAPVVSLAELFAEIDAARRDSVSHIEAARAGVLRFSREYELRDELRPFGWDDLCA